MAESDIARRLSRAEKLVDGPIDAGAIREMLEIMGVPDFPRPMLEEMRIYADYLPKAEELGFSHRERAMHFIWDSLDKSPACLILNFSIPLRRLLAKRMFASCGRNFIAEENVRFNLGKCIRVGSDVFINRGTYIDSKGGVSIGDRSALAEGVTIFTHSHSESVHEERTYAPVKIGNHAKIYAYAVILPGVTVGDGAIVAARSLVTKDVPAGAVAAGAPAKVIRPRKTEGRVGDGLGTMWFVRGEFQDER